MSKQVRDGSSAVWVVLQLAADVQYQGNEGYGDEPKKSYRWDSTVPNHAKVEEGDTFVVRDSDATLGHATVRKLVVEPDATKLRRRCPSCSSTGFKHRKRLRPKFRCGSCGGTFPTPSEETITITRYTAHYLGSWKDAPKGLSAVSLERACLSRARQHAIREADADEVRALLPSA
jgi:ribosomal protein S27AE